MTIPPIPLMARAIDAGDISAIQKTLKEHPEQLTYLRGGSGSWLHRAASDGNINVIDALIDAGIDVNVDSRGTTEHDPPLSRAVSSGQLDAARHLISRGANVNLGRELIGAINVGTDFHQDTASRRAMAFELVKLLVENGADINRWWYFGDPKKGMIFNALSWAIVNNRDDIADYLRARGAVMPPESKQTKRPPKGIEQEVIAYFEEHFGPVHPHSLGEIVPTGSPILVHAIPAGKDRKHITLFTTGLARRRMIMPKALKDYEYAELFMQVPANWPYTDIVSAEHGWPVHWLRMMAAFGLHEGLQPVTISEDEPSKLIAPNAKFTVMLVMAEKRFTSKKGHLVQLYRLTPLYQEERELEKREGTAALMRAFDEYDVPFIVDLKRRNVAKP